MFPSGQRWQHEREREGPREGHRGSRTPRTPRSPLEAVREEVDMLPAISITALNDPITIVHVPLHNADAAPDTHSSAIFWTLERAAAESVEFFNITSNRVEIAIFGACELVQDEWEAKAEASRGAGKEGRGQLRLSGPWRVFEVGSGDVDDEFETGNYDSPHLRFVSAPLAKEGITILYQSSYHADFLLVKESDFMRASIILGMQGWTINSTATPSPRSSTYGTPIAPFSPASLPRQPVVNPVGLLAATRPLTSSSAPSRSSPVVAPTSNTTPPSIATASASHSPPPFTPEITLLPSPLAMVGFHASSHNFSLHVAQIQKFVTWPARCIAATSTYSTSTWTQAVDGNPSSPTQYPERPFISYTRTQDGASLLTDVRAIRELFNDTEGLLCGEEIGKAWESEAESDFELEDSGDETEVSDDDDSAEIPSVSGAASAQSVDMDDDAPTPRAYQQPSSGCARSPNATPSEYPSNFPGSPSSTAERQRDKWAKHLRSRSDPLTAPAGSPTSRGRPVRPSVSHRHTAVPLTPSSSGASGVACSWAADEGGSAGPGGLHLRGTRRGGEKRKGRKRCLQLDLSGVRAGNEEQGTFHLDKSGLVTCFSTVLQRSNIRMLYSSTFHTANILVEAQDVRLAKEVLAPSSRRGA